MELSEGCFEIRDSDFCVDLGAVDGTVAEHLLDVTDGSPSLDEMCRAGVAESVERDGISAGELGSVVPTETVFHRV